MEDGGMAGEAGVLIVKISTKAARARIEAVAERRRREEVTQDVRAK